MFDTVASFLHQATGTLLLDPRFLVLYVFLLSTAYVHFRGRVRHSFVRQLTDHSTVMAPYNVLMYLFSRVPRDPVLPVETFPDLERLRVNWEVIRDECQVTPRFPQLTDTQIPAESPGASGSWGAGSGRISVPEAMAAPGGP